MNQETQPYRPGGVRELLSIALPMVVSQACETLMMFTDRVFLSRLGPEYINASMAGGLSAFLMMTFFFGLISYTSPLVAQYFGAKRLRECPLVVTQALIVAVLAYPLILAAVPVAQWFFARSGIAPEQLELQNTYFSIVTLGAGIALTRHALSCFFSGIGRTRVVMLAALISLVVNVVANYILIFGKFGCPALGIRGAAIGTIIGGAVGLLVTVIAYFRPSNQREFHVRQAHRIDLPTMKKLLRFGTPSGAEFFLNLLAFNILILSFHSYGTEVAAAVTIAFNWDMLCFLPLIGVNIGVSSLVGRHMGAGDPDLAHRTTMSGLKIAFFFAIFMVVAFGLFSTELVEVFHPSGEAAASFDQILPLATFMLRLVAVYVFADAVGVIFSGALRGAGDTFWTMVLSVAMHWVLAGVIVTLIRVANVPPKTAWMAMVVAVFGIGAVFYLRYRSGAWRKIRVLDTPAASGQEQFTLGEITSGEQ